MAKKYGSIRSVSINGVSFDIVSDSGCNQQCSPYETESRQGSMEDSYFQVKKEQGFSGLQLRTNLKEYKKLIELTSTLNPVNVMITEFSGDKTHYNGNLNLGERDKKEGTLEISMKAISTKLMPAS